MAKDPQLNHAETAAGRTARHLIRSCDRAALATRGSDDWPYSSLVMCAALHSGAPVLLLSDLAEHSRNIRSDDRVSLLYDGTGGLDDPLTGPRVSVQGRAVQVDDNPIHRSRFLARHLSAGDYVDFGDFHFYEIAMERAHLVAGFGQIEWAPADAILLSAQDGSRLIAAEADIIVHMNTDHRDAIQLYAASKGASGEDWRMTGIDPEGVDIARAGQILRLEFSEIVLDSTSARRELVQLNSEEKWV
ncbi:MAG: HugZ family pyridoxamine 5'-phosphate oxidase [Alphaproteobacteria bacterium]